MLACKKGGTSVTRSTNPAGTFAPTPGLDKSHSDALGNKLPLMMLVMRSGTGSSRRGSDVAGASEKSRGERNSSNPSKINSTLQPRLFRITSTLSYGTINRSSLSSDSRSRLLNSQHPIGIARLNSGKIFPELHWWMNLRTILVFPLPATPIVSVTRGAVLTLVSGAKSLSSTSGRLCKGPTPLLTDTWIRSCSLCCRSDTPSTSNRAGTGVWLGAWWYEISLSSLTCWRRASLCCWTTESKKKSEETEKN